MRCNCSKGNPMRTPSMVPPVLFVIGILFAAPWAPAQHPPQSPRSITFFGRVEAVDSDRKLVIVKHGKIPGYMDSGTTEYSTEEEAVLKRLHPRDDIRAVVYPNDLTLYRIQIVYRPPGPK
jgi:hypothetical protein